MLVLDSEGALQLVINVKNAEKKAAIISGKDKFLLKPKSFFGAEGRIRTCEPLRERISHHEPIRGQMLDLESFTFDLAWLPQPDAAKNVWVLSY